MKKTVQIVTIPLNKEGWNKGDLLFTGKSYKISPANRFNNHDWQAQQLLVLSDDEPKAGDICDDYCDVGEEPYTHLIGKCLSVDKANGWIKFDGYETGIDWCKKILASYPQIEGTLPISKETVQAWLDSGTPGEGSVEVYYGEVYSPILKMSVSNFKDEKSKTDPQGNLLLEFGKPIDRNYPEKYELTQEEAKEWCKSVKPFIPTNEEIREKALSALKKERDVDDGEQLSAFEGICITTVLSGLQTSTKRFRT